MEDVLNQISKEASAPKYAAIRNACKDASDLLDDTSVAYAAEPYQLRERCLIPLRLALESKNSKFVTCALGGIQNLLIEERFQSSLEADDDEKWLPMQIMNTVANLPCMTDETQVEVLKLLLNMTFTSTWCTNAKVITRITELCIETLMSTPKQSMRSVLFKTLLKMLKAFYQNKQEAIYLKQSEVLVSGHGAGTHGSVKTAARATITQLLSSLADKMKDDDIIMSEDADEEIAEFLNSGESEDISGDIVYILQYLCTKLSLCHKEERKQQAVPLLMEGIYAILSHVPTSIRNNQDFVDLLWKHLCPTMIILLGNPLQDKNVTQKHHTAEDKGRGSGCSANAPATDINTAKTLYNVTVELIRLVCSLQSLRPVVESVLHRMLLYPPPVHRLEAIKCLTPILTSPERLLDLAGPPIVDNHQGNMQKTSKKTQYNNIAPLKLIVDSLQECCHCNDSVVCITSVNLISELVKSLDQLAKGHGVAESIIFELHRQCSDLDSVSVTSSQIIQDQGYHRRNSLTDSVDCSTDMVDSSDEENIDFEGKDQIKKENKKDRNIFESEVIAERKSISPTLINENVMLKEEECIKVDSVDSERTVCVVDQIEQPILKTETDDRKVTSEACDKSVNASECDNAAFQKRCSNSAIEIYNKDSRDQQERQCAREYTRELIRALPDWLSSLCSTEVDEMIQRFSSDVCAAQHEDECADALVLNADGVYVVTYAALSLNLKLIRNGYYESEEKSLPMSEQQFVDEMLGMELLLYLSPYWLSEIFQQTIQTNFLEVAGYRDMGRDDCEETALIQILTDLDGLDSRKIGGQFLCGFRDGDAIFSPEETETSNPLAVQAGMKFSKRILIICGDAIVDVLSVLINGKSTCGITSSLSLMFNAKEESRKAREAICTCLEALQTTAKLSCTLGVQERCGTVFQELVAASCVIEEIKQGAQTKQKTGITIPLTNKPKLIRLHAAHSLSLDLLLSMGLEMGSHSKDCWKHVFRCCAHISELEHIYFSGGNNLKALPQVKQDMSSSEYTLDLNGDELFSPVMLPLEPVAPTINVTKLIKQSSIEAGWDSSLSSGGVLSSEQTSKVLCGLSQEVDRLFEDASNCLNMKALVNFLSELCIASQYQLNGYSKHTDLSQLPTNTLHLYRLGDVMLKCIRGERPLLHIMRCWAVVSQHLVEAACHRDRNISKKAVTCIHEVVTWLLSNRLELAYFHLNESLCKPYENLLCLELCDGDVQDQIVCSICELVEACTSEIKSGWRPLFGALRAVKIKYTTNEEVNEARQRHVTAVLDVFDVFLNTDNTMVFANAAVDCIMCLLKYVRGPSEFEEYAEDDSDSGGDYPSTSSEDLILPALNYLKQCCKILSSMWAMPASPVFHGANSIQSASIPQCVDPIIPGYDLEEFQRPFNYKQSEMNEETSLTCETASTQRDLDTKSVHSIDSGIGFHYPIPCATVEKKLNTTVDGNPNQGIGKDDKDEITDVKAEKDEIEEENAAKAAKHKQNAKKEVSDDIDYTKCNSEYLESIKIDMKEKIKSLMHYYNTDPVITYKSTRLSKLDNNTGVLRVWFLVLEGLAATVTECPKNYQPQTLELFFELLKSAAESPGAEFSFYCINHLLLPTLQNWMRKGNHILGYWNTSATANFKHCTGLCADLVVEYIVRFASEKSHQCAAEFMLKQLLDVLTECVAQPVESLSRLGCACIRHSLVSCGPVLTECMWQIAVEAIQHASDISLYCLRQLMTPFQEDSDNFYGDIGQVKVAVRKDCSGIECERIRQLAQQVFLLDSQRSDGLVVDYEKEEDRSYIFLIYPPAKNGCDIEESKVTRVPFRSVVVGLLSHQILIQTVGILLLQGSSNTVGSEKDILSAHLEEFDLQSATLGPNKPLPGLMKYMSCRNIMTLLECLYSSFQTAEQFDVRPGLKFLMQKVAKCQVAANLYKQTGISVMFYVHTLIEICINQDSLNVENVKSMLLEGLADMLNLESHGNFTEQSDKIQDKNEVTQMKSSVQSDIQVAASMDNQSIGETGLKHEELDGNINSKICLLKSQKELANHSVAHTEKHIVVFLFKLKTVFDNICTKYIEMYLEKEGPNAADCLSKQLLVFLVAPEELPSLKREKSIKEMVEEKLSAMEQEVDTPMSKMFSAPVPLEEQQELTEETISGDISVCNSVPEPGDNSPALSHKYSDDVDKVYEVATDKTIKSLMTEYKKRKQAQTMPTFVKQQRSHIKKEPQERKPTTDPVDRQIEEDQRVSIVKDSDAQLNAYIEMICNLLQLFLQLPDNQYQALLPVVFNFINQLTCHCRHRMLRDTLAQWMFRIGHLYNFAPLGVNKCPKSKY